MLVIVLILVICYWTHKVCMRWNNATKQRPLCSVSNYFMFSYTYVCSYTVILYLYTRVNNPSQGAKQQQDKGHFQRRTLFQGI